MNKYMGYDRTVWSSERTCLVFANSAKEARNLAFPVISGWYADVKPIDIVAKTIKGHDYLNKECKSGEPHVIESPKSCNQCNLWTNGELIEGVCETCREIDEEE